MAALLMTAGIAFADQVGDAPSIQDQSLTTTPSMSTGAPLAPAGLVIKPVTITRMALQWKAAGFGADGNRLATPGPAVDGYHIEQSLDGKIFTKVQDVDAAATFCNLADLKPATGYWFRIGAYNSSGVTYSPAVQVATIGEGTGLTGHYYSWTGLQNPIYPKYDRVDPYIDFDWVAMAAQDPNVSPHNFMVVWTGQVQPLFTETYTFVVSSDDGDRLWIDGKKVIENWTEHPANDDTVTVDLVAGKKYDIKLAYFENNDGPASIKFSWSSPSQTKQVVLPCQLYAKTALEETAAAEESHPKAASKSTPKPATKTKPHGSRRLSHRRLH